MTARLSQITERLLVGAMALIFFLPLPLAVVANNRQYLKSLPFLSHPWFSNKSLQGVTVDSPEVRFSWRALASGDFQRSKATRFNGRFPGREIFIRWTNETWFRLFHETASLNSIIDVGSRGALFEKGYLHEYFIQRTEKQTIAPWVKDLRRLQDFCRNSGTGFLVLISPSKAAFCPEETPLAWRRYYDPRPRAYVHLVELFRENGILFVDAPALLAAERSAHPPAAPFFPKGGTHWNSRAVWLVANEVMAQLRAQGQPLDPLTVLESRLSLQPEGRDEDLAQLMNLVHPLSYPCERVSLERETKPKEAQRTMAVIGGSFSAEFICLLSTSGQFSEISNHFYYRLYKNRVAENQIVQIRSSGIPEDFAREIFGADCLVLEMNESSAPFADHHLTVFVKDALAHLPDPAAARPPFRSD